MAVVSSSVVRHLEGLICKLLNAKWSTVFNEACLKDIYIYILLANFMAKGIEFVELMAS